MTAAAAITTAAAGSGWMGFGMEHQRTRSTKGKGVAWHRFDAKIGLVRLGGDISTEGKIRGTRGRGMAAAAVASA